MKSLGDNNVDPASGEDDKILSQKQRRRPQKAEKGQRGKE